MLDTLKKVFGFTSFLPDQETIIRNILNRKDVFAVLPTGGGKSLCYQLPSKIMPGTTVVISPLISLMKDQVDAAQENGISALYLNSSLNPVERSEVYRDLKKGDLELLYIAPERFVMGNFLEELKTVQISLFAIDEAHCISEWGHDFRPDYLSLTHITSLFPDIPVAAFTATATVKVQDDIIKKTGLRTPYVVRASFNRHNLFYQVKRKEQVEYQILNFIHEHENEPGIVYRTTRDSVLKLADFLAEHGVRALPYHAGLAAEERKRNQEAFSRDEAAVMVATIAFGMGIDKSNVRFVIHADLPKNIESYYQETGRAGRDGEPANCLLYFSRGDIPKLKYFIDRIADDKEREIATEKLYRMVRYASHNICRRSYLLEYFGENYPAENCGACDICTGMVEKIDITIDAQIIMSAMLRTGQRFGIRHTIDIVCGANTKRIRELRHDKIKTYGAGKHEDKKHWHFLVDELLVQDVIHQDGDKYPVLKLTKKGIDILHGKETIDALKTEEKKKRPRALGDEGFTPYDEYLFEKLRALRKKIAEEQNVPPFIIFSDRTLHEMCRYYPGNMSDMKRISGVGDTKLEQYGEGFIREIKAYINENPGRPERQSSDEQSFFPHANLGPKRIKGETIQKTHELFEKGLSIEQIAKVRNLAKSTIEGHLEQLIRDRKDIDINRLVDPAKQDEIKESFLILNTWKLNPIVEYFNGKVSYEEAKFMRTLLQQNDSKKIIEK
ncbi:ATP-dependent DNA helicase RecQ [subsurface metagenome]